MIGLILNSSYMSALRTLFLLVTPFTNFSTFMSAAVILLFTFFVSIHDSCPYNSISLRMVMTHVYQGRVAGTGRRLGRDVDSTSRLGSLDTSERNYWVAHHSHSEPRRPDWPVYSCRGHRRTAHVRVADLGTPRECC